MAVDSTVQALGRSWRSAVLAASGTFGYGREFEGLADFSRLGGIVTKGLSLRPRAGNPLGRIAETSAGMLNSIGLENVGVEAFIRDKLPFLRQTGVRVVCNFFGERFEEYADCASLLTGHEGIDALEMNVSCPNIKAGGMEYGTDARMLARLVESCRRVTDLPLIVKLTPNVTDIVTLARAAVDAGADALSLINTISAMAVDAATRKPKLATVFGGLSGPAIKPIALRMVYQVARARLGVPIFGIGGITTGEDAAEFLLCGASFVQVGTWNFIDPDAAARVSRELETFANGQGLSVRDLVGRLEADDSLLPHTPES